MAPGGGVEPPQQPSKCRILPLNEPGTNLAPHGGLEPPSTESESAVLPLNERGKMLGKLGRNRLASTSFTSPNGSGSRDRTCDDSVNSRGLLPLSYPGTWSPRTDSNRRSSLERALSWPLDDEVKLFYLWRERGATIPQLFARQANALTIKLRSQTFGQAFEQAIFHHSQLLSTMLVLPGGYRTVPGLKIGCGRR